MCACNLCSFAKLTNGTKVKDWIKQDTAKARRIRRMAMQIAFEEVESVGAPFETPCR